MTNLNSRLYELHNMGQFILRLRFSDKIGSSNLYINTTDLC